VAGLSADALQNPEQREKILNFVEDNKDIISAPNRKQSTRRRRKPSAQMPESQPPRHRPEIVHTVAVRKRFYESPFRPKTFWTNFVIKFSSENYSYASKKL
jgi:hypothetical protein